jgi:hypothetical protein
MAVGLENCFKITSAKELGLKNCSERRKIFEQRNYRKNL